MIEKTYLPCDGLIKASYGSHYTLAILNMLDNNNYSLFICKVALCYYKMNIAHLIFFAL